MPTTGTTVVMEEKGVRDDPTTVQNGMVPLEMMRRSAPRMWPICFECSRLAPGQTTTLRIQVPDSAERVR